MPSWSNLLYYGDKAAIAEETQTLYKQKGYKSLAGTVPLIIQLVLLMGVVGAVRSLLGDADSISFFVDCNPILSYNGYVN